MDKRDDLIRRYFIQQEEAGFPDAYMMPSPLYPPSTPLLPTDSGIQTASPEIVQSGSSIPVKNESDTMQRAKLANLFYEVRECHNCVLCKTRNSFVFGSGNASADIMVIGEAPGFEEDRQGVPFVGPAGNLLTKMLSAIDLDRKTDVFIANVLKCRPPGNRTPNEEECAACLPILRRQIAIIQPKAILLVGRSAANAVLGNTASLSALRGKRMTFQSIAVMVTYHPAALLRDSSKKRPTWEDLKVFKTMLEELENGRI